MRARFKGVMFTEMQLPHINNVYGYFTSNESLVKLERVFKTRLSFPALSVVVNKSRYDRTQSISLQNGNLEFESRKFNNKGVYGFNGAVGGTELEVKEIVKEIYLVLEQNNFDPRFEIYNSEFECVHEFKT